VAERIAAEVLSAIPLDEAAQACLEREEALTACAESGEAGCANGCVAPERRGEDRGSPTAGAPSAAIAGPPASGCVAHERRGDSPGASTGAPSAAVASLSANGCVAHELGGKCLEAGGVIAGEASSTTAGGAAANGCIAQAPESDPAVGSARPAGAAAANGCVPHGSGSNGCAPQPLRKDGRVLLHRPRDVARLFRGTLATVQRRIA
jgi:hypothetical protein